MASPLVQASLRTPGFLGLNTEQSAASSQERFATMLENAVFDEAGKVVCRQGFDKLADGGPDSVSQVFAWRKDENESLLMAVGDATGTATLYQLTQTSTEFDTFTSRGTMNSEAVKLVNVNGYLTVHESGQAPKAWDGTGTLAAFAAATGTTANPTGGIATSAFGRLFVVSEDRKTVYGSELQPDPKTTGCNWDNWFIDTTGNSGATSKDGWTYGRDFITGIGAIDDYLVIFGTSSILIYSDVNGTPTLSGSMSGVGCVNQQTIANVGDDLVFLSNSGVRSLQRTIQSETVALNDISAYVRTDLLDRITPANARGVYAELEGFYILSDGNFAYMFDMRQALPGGARRASQWTLTPSGMAYCPCTNTLYLSTGAKVGQYADYLDDTDSYKLTLKSSWLDLGKGNLKIIKKLAALIYKGDSYTPKFYLAFDYNEQTEDQLYAESLPRVIGAEWGLAEWSEDEFVGTLDQVNYRYVNGAGNGLFVRYGVEFTVNQFEVGIHEIRLLAKLGKLAHV